MTTDIPGRAEASEDDELAAFARAQASGRRKQLALGAAAVAGLTAVVALALRLSASSPCDALAAELCSMASRPDCTPLRQRLAAVAPDSCASTLAALHATSDRTIKLSIASRALSELVPPAAKQ